MIRFSQKKLQEEEEEEEDLSGFRIQIRVQAIKGEKSQKVMACQSMKERLEKWWIHKVLTDSLKWSCINIHPSNIKQRKPYPHEKKNLKRISNINTLAYFGSKGEEMTRKLISKGLIEEAPIDSDCSAH